MEREPQVINEGKVGRIKDYCGNKVFTYKTPFDLMVRACDYRALHTALFDAREELRVEKARHDATRREHNAIRFWDLLAEEKEAHERTREEIGVEQRIHESTRALLGEKREELEAFKRGEVEKKCYTCIKSRLNNKTGRDCPDNHCLDLPIDNNPGWQPIPEEPKPVEYACPECGSKTRERNNGKELWRVCCDEECRASSGKYRVGQRPDKSWINK